VPNKTEGQPIFMINSMALQNRGKFDFQKIVPVAITYEKHHAQTNIFGDNLQAKDMCRCES